MIDLTSSNTSIDSSSVSNALGLGVRRPRYKPRQTLFNHDGLLAGRQRVYGPSQRSLLKSDHAREGKPKLQRRGAEDKAEHMRQTVPVEAGRVKGIAYHRLIELRAAEHDRSEYGNRNRTAELAKEISSPGRRAEVVKVDGVLDGDSANRQD